MCFKPKLNDIITLSLVIVPTLISLHVFGKDSDASDKHKDIEFILKFNAKDEYSPKDQEKLAQYKADYLAYRNGKLLAPPSHPSVTLLKQALILTPQLKKSLQDKKLTWFDLQSYGIKNKIEISVKPDLEEIGIESEDQDRLRIWNESANSVSIGRSSRSRSASSASSLCLISTGVEPSTTASKLSEDLNSVVSEIQNNSEMSREPSSISSVDESEISIQIHPEDEDEDEDRRPRFHYEAGVQQVLPVRISSKFDNQKRNESILADSELIEDLYTLSKAN